MPFQNLLFTLLSAWRGGKKEESVPDSNYKLCAIYYKMFAPHGRNYHKNKTNIYHKHYLIVELREKKRTSALTQSCFI